MHSLPATGFLRLSQIIGNKKAEPPIPPLIPVCASSWWNGVRNGRYPKPLKLGPRTTVWKVEDIRTLIDSATEQRGLCRERRELVPAWATLTKGSSGAPISE